VAPCGTARKRDYVVCGCRRDGPAGLREIWWIVQRGLAEFARGGPRQPDRTCCLLKSQPI